MVSALAITLGILFLIFYLLKSVFARRGGALGSRGLIRVISTTYLGGKRSLVLADIAGKKLLLGLSPQAITLLANIDSQESLETISAAERGGQEGKPFLWYLESFMAKHLGKGESTGAKQ
jgi:flagellar biogenesis protein FliO